MKSTFASVWYYSLDRLLSLAGLQSAGERDVCVGCFGGAMRRRKFILSSVARHRAWPVAGRRRFVYTVKVGELITHVKVLWTQNQRQPVGHRADDARLVNGAVAWSRDMGEVGGAGVP
jgi:hypothetical protein